MTTLEVSSSGASATHADHAATTSAAASAGYVRLPAYTVVTGNSAISISVTTPRHPPPPPRSARNSSGCSFAQACTNSPSGVTTSNERTASHAGPYRRASQPSPPPSVEPTAPTALDDGTRGARPWRWASARTGAHVQPAPTQAVRLSASTSRWSIRAVTSSTPSTGRATPCPVACTPSPRPVSAANDTAAITSPTSAATTTVVGVWVDPRFQPATASAKPGSPGTSTAPSTRWRRAPRRWSRSSTVGAATGGVLTPRGWRGRLGTDMRASAVPCVSHVFVRILVEGATGIRTETRSAAGHRRLRHLGERHVAVDLGLARQSEHALADDVALDLVGAAADRREERVERQEVGVVTEPVLAPVEEGLAAHDQPLDVGPLVEDPRH